MQNFSTVFLKGSSIENVPGVSASRGDESGWWPRNVPRSLGVLGFSSPIIKFSLAHNFRDPHLYIKCEKLHRYSNA